MTAGARHTDRPRGVLAFLAAVLAVVLGVFGAGPASAATTHAAQNAVGASTSAVQNAVGASTSAVQVVVGPSAGVVAGQQLGNDPPQPQIAVATGVAAKTGDDWAKVSGALRDASRGKGHFGVGTGTVADAQSAVRAWAGEGARLASDGRTWLSQDGLRQWRPPTFKPGWQGGTWQSKFESRLVPRGQWQTNGHLDITDLL